MTEPSLSNITRQAGDASAFMIPLAIATLSAAWAARHPRTHAHSKTHSKTLAAHPWRCFDPCWTHAA